MTIDNEQALQKAISIAEDYIISDDEIEELRLRENALKAELKEDTKNVNIMAKIVGIEMLIKLGEVKNEQLKTYLNNNKKHD